jgi:hypothetical protein
MVRHFAASAKRQDWTMDTRTPTYTLDAVSRIRGRNTRSFRFKGIQKLVTGSSQDAESLHLLSKVRRLWRDSVSLRALYFIPGAIQAALSKANHGPGNTVTILSFLDSFEPWAVADALTQYPRVDMKTRLNTE